MPAVVRGGRRQGSTKGRGQSSRNAPPTPGKVAAIGRLDLSPRAVLISIVAGIVVLGGVLATGARAERISNSVSHKFDSVTSGMGLKVRQVHVTGASPEARAAIQQAVGVRADQPIVSLDLNAVRDRVQAVGWVKEARVVRLLPDTLVLAVTERRQLAVWQHNGRSYVIDETGRVIPEADPGRFARLPLIVGAGANEAAAAILPEVAARPRLAERTEALIRVDGRRWDLRMKDGSLVQLPAVDEGAALIQLEQLDQRSRILELGFERIDLRDPSVVAVRPRDGVLPGQLVANGA